MSRAEQVILAVDDSPADLELLRRAFAKVSPTTRLQTVGSGEEALFYLAGTDKYANRRKFPLPMLIILDLKMPEVTGFHILERLEKMSFRQRPFVIVISSSPLTEDINRSVSLGATACHPKPNDFDELCQLVARIAEFFTLAPAVLMPADI